MVIPRRKADKNISVGSMQSAFEEFMQTMKSRDLHSLFKVALSGANFKNAACPIAISSLNFLLRPLLSLAPNAQLPRANLARAIAATHSSMPTNFSGEETGLWSQRLGEATRVQMTHLYSLLDETKKEIALKKACAHHYWEWGLCSISGPPPQQTPPSKPQNPPA